MKRNRGFTLVELLVVMAIIAILASIVVPNVQRYIVRARVTRAVAEVSGMELSLTAITTDAGRGNLSQIFMPDSAQTFWPNTLDNPSLFNADLFNNAAKLYSQIMYDLLRLGRDCARDGSETIAQLYIDHDVLAKLGTNYMDIGLDPWGETYRVWPGPWRFSTVGLPLTGNIAGQPVTIKRWPIPFRIFSVETSSSGGSSFAVQKDPFLLRGSYKEGAVEIDVDWLPAISQIEAPETWPSQVSLPAQANKSAFIWSFGANTRSSQMLYSAAYEMDPFGWYYSEAEEDVGGGDDVNNWDNGTSWQRFYQ